MTRVAYREIGSRNETMRTWLERIDDRFMGSPVAIDPLEALLKALSIAAGEVDYCDAQIRKLQEDELFERPLRQVWTELPSGRMTLIEEARDPEEFSRWVKARNAACERMARFAKLALDNGIEERQVRLAERQAVVMVDFFEAVAARLSLTPKQQRQLGPAMREQLQVLEGVITSGG